MRIRMLRGTAGPDGLACEVGGVYDLPDPWSQLLIKTGRALPVETEPVSPIVVANRQTMPAKRR